MTAGRLHFGAFGCRLRVAVLAVLASMTSPARAAAAADAGPAVGPASGPATGPELAPLAGGLVEVMINLGLVIGAIVLFGWLLRRMQGAHGHGGGALRVAGSLSVGPKERVLLIDVGERLLVGVAPGGLRTLHVLDEPLTPEDPRPSRRKLRPAAARMLKGGRT